LTVALGFRRAAERAGTAELRALFGSLVRRDASAKRQIAKARGADVGLAAGGRAALAEREVFALAAEAMTATTSDEERE
jgi:hypothetical protein